jgi:hypothetical protein
LNLEPTPWTGCWAGNWCGTHGALEAWDRQVVNLQVTDANEGTVELRALVSAANASAAWDLRCEVREQLIAFLQREYPHALPRRRAEVLLRDAAAGAAARPVPLRPTGESAAAASRAP